MCRCSVWRHGLVVDLAVQGWTLFFVCSNLSHSVKKGEFFAGAELGISVSKKVPYQIGDWLVISD